MMTAPPSAALRDRPRRRPRILMADDQPLDIRAPHALPAAAGDVMVASDGAAALRRCEAHRPDLVMPELMMPKLDGHAVRRRPQDSGPRRDIPVLFLTGSRDAADEPRGFEVGAADFIRTPIALDLPHAGSPVRATVSVSMAAAPVPDAAGLPRLAGRQLYAAKHSGRARCNTAQAA